MKKLYLDTKEKIYRATSIIFIVQLFGALGAGYFIKHWRISFFPIIVMIIVLVFAPTMGASTLLFVGIIASVGGALFMYKKGMLDRVK